MIPSLPHLELLRDGVAGIPEPGSNVSGVPVFVDGGEDKPLRACTCSDGKKICDHLKELGRSLTELRRHLDGASWEELFVNSRWYRLARLLFESQPLAGSHVEVAQLGDGPGATLLWSSPSRGELARVFTHGALRVRLLERLGRAPEGNGFIDRAAVLSRLAGFQRSRAEREMNKRGIETARQSWELSFWYAMAYHWVRELGPEGGSFEAAVNRESGALTLTFHGEPEIESGDEAEALCRVVVPRRRVSKVLELLAPAHGPSPFIPQLLACTFAQNQGDGGPLLEMLRTPGDQLLARVDEKFRYGRVVYLPELEVLVRPHQMREDEPEIPLPSSELGHVPSFFDSSFVVHEELVVHHPPQQRRTYTAPEALELHVEAMEHGRWWISLHLAFGKRTVLLGDLWHARHHADVKRFDLGHGEIDLDAVLNSCEPLLRDRDPEDDHLLLSAVDLLRWRGADVAPLRVRGRKTRAGVVRKLFELRPTESFEVPPGFAAELSAEELHLAEWMAFLWEHRLGGIACELGKDGGLLPVLALLLKVHEPASIRGPSGTSLILGDDHTTWQEALGAITPQLRAAPYDPEIDLETLMFENDLLLLDYATLRGDLSLLRSQSFALVICDDVRAVDRLGRRYEHAIGQLKNRVKLGLCDSKLGDDAKEMKRLLDLMSPGFLGSDEFFTERYEKSAGTGRRAELGRLVEPLLQSPRKRRGQR